jgi:GNAT superfamily N-acetyltransferase
MGNMEEQNETQGRIRGCGAADAGEMLEIINAAAEAFRGVIPADRWHEPYMPADELAAEMADDVVFSGIEVGGRLVGVMGAQRRCNVDLVRHAYVLPDWQGHGIGSRLLNHLCHGAAKPILIGTWAAAHWAIRFYERHGFARVAMDDIAPLLRTYWNVPDRQVDTSVVLASPPLVGDAASRLIAAAKD